MHPFFRVPDQCAAVHRAVQHCLPLRGEYGREALLRHCLDLLRGVRPVNVPFVLVRPHRDKVRLPALLPDQQICPSGDACRWKCFQTYICQSRAHPATTTSLTSASVTRTRARAVSRSVSRRTTCNVRLSTIPKSSESQHSQHAVAAAADQRISIMDKLERGDARACDFPLRLPFTCEMNMWREHTRNAKHS